MSGCSACNDVDVIFTTFPNKTSDHKIKKLIILCIMNRGVTGKMSWLNLRFTWPLVRCKM